MNQFAQIIDKCLTNDQKTALEKVRHDREYPLDQWVKENKAFGLLFAELVKDEKTAGVLKKLGQKNR